MNTQINDIFDEILGTTLDTYRILREGGPDAERLFFFYLYTAKIQKTKTIYATTGFCAKGLDIGEKRIQKAKNYLREVGLIQDKRETGENGQAEKWYVEVSYIFKRSTLVGIVDRKAEERENHPVENGGGGDENHPRRFATGGETDPQMLKEISYGNNIEMLKDLSECDFSENKKGKEKKETTEKPKDPKYPCNLFLDFWNLYPRKIDKPKAWTEWKKLSAEDKAAAIEGVKAWLKLWTGFTPEEKSFIIYPERFIKNRRFEQETISTDLATKLKARMAPGSGNKRTAEEIEEAKRKEAIARKKIEDEERRNDEEKARVRRESDAVLNFFESMPDAQKQKIDKEVEDLLEKTGIAKMKDKFPKIYQDSRRGKIVQLARSAYSDFVNTVGA